MRVKVEFETTMMDSVTSEDIDKWLVTSFKAGLSVSNVIADERMELENIVVTKI